MIMEEKTIIAGPPWITEGFESFILMLMTT